MTPRSALVLATILRPLDLDRDERPVGEGGAVDLRGRGGGERLLLDRREQLLRRSTELRLDHLAGVQPGERRGVGLQPGELGRPVRRQQVRARGQHLADLHVGRPELLQERRDALAARSRPPSGGPRRGCDARTSAAMPPIGVPSNAMSMLVWYSASYTCWSRRFSMIVLRRGVGSDSRNVQTERPPGTPTCGRLSPSTTSATMRAQR